MIRKYTYSYLQQNKEVKRDESAILNRTLIAIGIVALIAGFCFMNMAGYMFLGCISYTIGGILIIMESIKN